MASLSSSKPRNFGAYSYSATPCTRTHQIGALFLVVSTFFVTRILDQYFSESNSVTPATDLHRTSSSGITIDKGIPQWPERGYGSHLSLKIYVYDENEIDGLKELMYGRDGSVKTAACLKGQWGSQVKIHKLLMESKFRTSKKEEADLFFVPAYVKCVRMLGGLNDKEINQTYVKGDRTDKKDTTAFNTWKDIIIPGNVDDAMTKNGQPDVQPLPLSKRKYLANYLGRAQGKAGRLKLIDLSKQYPDKLECPDLKFSGTEKFGRTTYFEHLRNAKFCLAPRGESSWTLRFYESFFVECVPVLLSDHAELPFQNVVDYAQVSIKWPSSRIGSELLDYLASIPDRDIEGMISRGRKIRCLFVYGPDSAPCSAVKGILWELQRKARHFQQSTETFWLHNGSVVNRELVHFSSWRPPMPLP